MKLTILDRLVIPTVILPKHGKLIEMMIAESITEVIRFTPDQITQFGLKDTENGTVWSSKEDNEMEFSFTPEQVKCLKDSVDRLDIAGQITKDTLKTCQKILSL